MNRFFMMMLALAAIGLTFGAGCGKDEAAKADEATKPAEAPVAEKTAEKAPEAAKEEAAPAAEGEAAPAAEGEAAPAGDTVTTGVAECDALIASYSKCEKMPQASRDAFMTGAKGWKDAVEAGGDAAKTSLATACKQAADASKAALDAFGCK